MIQFFMIHKVVSLLFLSFTLTFNTNAQTIISGVVCSKIDNEPIPFAAISHTKNKFGIYADESGKFEIEISEKYLGDTLKFYCVGFEEICLIIRNGNFLN